MSDLFPPEYVAPAFQNTRSRLYRSGKFYTKFAGYIPFSVNRRYPDLYEN